ncbi:hypothetical protein DMJ13_21650 [halophilic archaeon]|nr:hypothetical protein DMJ13_21650 [halophilic archaeon]
MQAKTLTRLLSLLTLAVLLLVQPSTAHVGSLGGTVSSTTVPTWLMLLTGGGIVGASFLFTSLMTDHAAIRAINGWRLSIPTPHAIRTAVQWLIRGASIGILLMVILIGLTGPRTPTSNFAILVVWAGWWAGYTMTVYLIGNTWPVLNPWRTLAEINPRDRLRSYPNWVGVWPSVAGLLGLVWLEVVSPVAEDPQLLSFLIIGYTLLTLAGATVYGTDTWFGRVDPVSRVFRCYSRLAPFQRTESGLAFKLPSAALAERQVALRIDETAFIIALLWVTTYDGFVSTALWAEVARPLVRNGVPPLLLYLLTILGGFGLFFAIYRFAAQRARQSGRTYVTPAFIEGWFAQSLLPIAAGYHVAHFLGYFLTLAPALLTVSSQPFSPPANVQVLVLPGWFAILPLLFVLLGHVLAIWIAHALAFDLFPGKLKPIHCQYPFIIVMIFYTMTSLWIVAQPFTAPPYV